MVLLAPAEPSFLSGFKLCLLQSGKFIRFGLSLYIGMPS